VEKDGTALSQGRSLPPAWTLVTPYCKHTRPGRRTNTKAAGFTSHACLPPASLPPFALRLAPTHLGWGTRRQFTRRSWDPPGSKRRQSPQPSGPPRREGAPSLPPQAWGTLRHRGGLEPLARTTRSAGFQPRHTTGAIPDSVPNPDYYHKVLGGDETGIVARGLPAGLPTGWNGR
jgi:hypothetical protein